MTGSSAECGPARVDAALASCSCWSSPQAERDDGGGEEEHGSAVPALSGQSQLRDAEAVRVVEAAQTAEGGEGVRFERVLQERVAGQQMDCGAGRAAQHTSSVRIGEQRVKQRQLGSEGPQHCSDWQG